MDWKSTKKIGLRFIKKRKTWKGYFFLKMGFGKHYHINFRQPGYWQHIHRDTNSHCYPCKYHISAYFNVILALYQLSLLPAVWFLRQIFMSIPSKFWGMCKKWFTHFEYKIQYHSFWWDTLQKDSQVRMLRWGFSCILKWRSNILGIRLKLIICKMSRQE